MNSLLLNFEGEVVGGLEVFDDFDSASLIGFDFDEGETAVFCSWLYFTIATL